MKKKIANILVALDLSGSDGRRVLAGILNERRFSRSADFTILHKPHDLMSIPLDDGSVDGIITYVDNEMAKRLASSRVPLVALDFVPPALYRRKENISVIVEDNDEIGRLGASHLLSLGNFAAVGFVPDEKNRGWSRIREHAFANAVRKTGREVWRHDSRKISLDGWLKEIPKPAAVMTAFDFRSMDVLNACARCGIKVPEQVAVIGVDNDCLLCEQTSPPLSSIDYDLEALGTLAVRTVFRMIRSRRPWSLQKPSTATNARVVDRASTRQTAISAHLAARALDFIDRHYGENISAQSVSDALRVSRRLVELRLSEAGAPSLRRAIEDRRMKELTRLLKTTAMPIARATEHAGFRNVQRAKYVFRKRFGMSMGQMRRSQAESSRPG